MREQQKHVAIVLKGYPRLSETFIAQELLGLQEAGLSFTIYSLRQPYDPTSHPIHAEITAPVVYLPEYLHQAPLRLVRGIWKMRKSKAVRHVLKLWWRDFRRDLSRNRLRRLGQAFVFAAEMPADVSWIYVHFLHTPASVTRYAALMRDIPWSCSAHAKDIYTTPHWDKAEKISDMEWLVTCTAANVDYLRDIAGQDAGKIHLLYHGLDLERFPSRTPRMERPDAPLVILSVGRAVAKKGYGDLLQALSDLPEELDWRFVHIGGGTNLNDLKATARNLGIDHRIEWRGAQPQSAVIEAYRQADLFVLASRIADDGDRDGLPNVLMEAQSQGVACISTKVSAIPELIIDGETGLLVEPASSAALTHAIAQLAGNRDLRARLGEAGAQRVRNMFSHETGIEDLARRFGLRRPAREAQRTDTAA